MFALILQVHLRTLSEDEISEIRPGAASLVLKMAKYRKQHTFKSDANDE